MTRDAVIETIENLSVTTGFYGRLLRYLEEMREVAPDRFEEVMKELETCGDAVDLVMKIEG